MAPLVLCCDHHASLQDDSRDPVYVGAVGFAASTLAIFLFSFAFNNTSFFDLYWSVAPVGLIIYWPRVAYYDGQKVGAAPPHGLTRTRQVCVGRKERC
jgi:hypothetical protein